MQEASNPSSASALWGMVRPINPPLETASSGWPLREDRLTGGVLVEPTDVAMDPLFLAGLTDQFLLVVGRNYLKFKIHRHLRMKFDAGHVLTQSLDRIIELDLTAVNFHALPGDMMV